jgi:hypothetical protein
MKLVSGLAGPRYGEKLQPTLQYLDWSEGEVWACGLHVLTLRTVPP